ncbi:hypothetical protein ACVGVM_26525 [Pseudonocardia bannensis]|uniref:Uncharacterized protein n=1 Tax=Pseudonocardia bannensis TaxID=630973 RepID=A0A848DDW6_9PSEU|nr:hypothetical protein [Pseudonocardia bannensis]NMH90784.1 hypothetical protein [Pseudonocardia bannensis]
MRRPNSTVVIVAGTDAEKVVAGLAGLANVRAVASSRWADASVDRLVAGANAPYVVHDADPLAGVASAWTGFFDGERPPGTVEVAVEAVLAALRDGEALLPDYYVVLDPDSLPGTLKHWWLGVLAGASPSRVVPSPASAAAVRDILSRLPSGRWWPDPPEPWLRGLSRVVPDRAGLPGPATT